jgi:pilus assembly protein Flp/PilA
LLKTEPQEITMTNLVARFAKDESGATAIEYGLIAALIAVAIIAGGRLLGQNINAKFNTIAGEVKKA